MAYHLASLLLLLCGAQTALAQASYVGTVGGAPIALALNTTADGLLTGVYLCPKFGTPIGLGGRLRRGVLTLTEQDARGKASATLTIPAFAAGASQLTGTWRSLASGRTVAVALRPGPATRPELLQAESLKNSYFNIVLASPPGSGDNRVVAVRLLEKKTNRLVQQLAVDCQPQGIYSVQVGDFNFDGLPDFSVFESSYAGPNTTSLYYLYDPARRRYIASGFEGTSLEFDVKKRRVYEHNSCCAGSSLVTIEYKVLRNKLMPVARHCLRWDDKKQQFVERPFSACQ